MSQNTPQHRTSTANKPEQFVLFDNLTVELDSRTLLKEETLVIKPGEITVLTGPSGIDKSVLADLVFNLPRCGKVQSKADALGESRSQGALVFRDSVGLPHLSVNDNLRLVSCDQYRCEQVAKRLGLELDVVVSNLGGVERHRLAIARALLAYRRFLWLDEPETGLDLRLMEELAEMLKGQAREEQLAIIVTTNNTVFASDVADRILFLGQDGRLAEINTLHELDPGFADDHDQVAAFSSSDTALQKPGGVDHNTLRVDLTRRLADSERHSQSSAASLFPRFSKVMFHLRRPFNLDAFSWLFVIARSILRLPYILSNRQARSTFLLSLKLSAWHGIVYYPLLGAVFGAVLIMIYKYTMPTYWFYGYLIQTNGAAIAYSISPPVVAILVAACTGSTISSWVGQLSATRQFDAFRVLGVRVDRLVLVPVWWGLWFTTMFGIISFALALSAVFSVYLNSGLSPLALYISPYQSSLFWPSFPAGQQTDFSYPGLGHALLRSAGYGMLIGGVIVSYASASVRSSSDVAAAVTRGFVWSSVLIMLAELAILLICEDSVQARIGENARVVIDLLSGQLTELVNFTLELLEIMHASLAEFVRSLL